MYHFDGDRHHNMGVVEEIKELNQKKRREDSPADPARKAARITASYMKEISRIGKRDRNGEYGVDPATAQRLLDRIISHHKNDA